jgi:XTP/dITP diphosphohydrolase
VYENYSENCFADDTGLEVDALNGEPGVYSARYAGEEKNAQANMDLLLEKMKGEKNRNARFRTVISLVLNGEEYQFEGVVEGKIREKKSGAAGFGYDPIFEPNGYSATFAEMSTNEKNAISHRGKAVRKLIQFLNNM